MSAQDNNIWYFAYGSNLRELRMKERQVTYTARIKELLHGYELVFNKKAGGKEGYGYANIQRREGATVKGALYAVTAEGISMLDRFEGYPNHYTRITIPVEKEDKETVEAVVYVAQPEHLADGLKVTDEYLNHVMSGQDLWGELFAAEVRVVARGQAVTCEEIQNIGDNQELMVLVDGVKARITSTTNGFSVKIVIIFEEPHPTEGLKDFATKYFTMNEPGCLEWGHFGRCFAVQHRTELP